jgi:tetratricopeptide (TPR) repeat protein
MLPPTSDIAHRLTGGADGAFQIRSDIPIPLECAEGESAADILPRLNLEMILAGMIHALVDGGSPHRRYYRQFIRACKPRLLREFCEAAAVKAENGDFALSGEIAAALKAVFPRSAKALHARAVVFEVEAASLRARGRTHAARLAEKKAGAAYRAALSLKEPLTRTLFNAGCFYFKLENYAKALAYLRQFLLLSGDDAQKKEAAELVRRIESDNLDSALLREARASIEGGEAAAAVEKLRVFLRDHPAVWQAQFMLGWALRRLGYWQEAEEALRLTLAAGAARAEIRNELALCLLELGRPDEARAELERALAGEPENITVLSNMAVLELKAGSKDRALALFRTVLEYAPEDPIARRYVDQG